MKKRRFTVEQIIQILAEVEKDNSTVVSVYRRYCIGQDMYYRWGKEYKKTLTKPVIIG